MLKKQKNNVFVVGFVAILSVLLVTPTAKADLDLTWIEIQYEKDHNNGNVDKWEFDIFVVWSDKGSLDHIDITLPGGSTVYTITAEEYFAGYDSSTPYASLADLQDDYPQGIYTLDFRDSSNTLLRTISLDFSGLPSEPTKPVDFTYPATDGATGLPTNPTFTWTVDTSDGDLLTMWIKDESGVVHQTIYASGPQPMTTTSWTPGPLTDGHTLELNVEVFTGKGVSGADWPSVIVDGDQFTYSLNIGYKNEIDFTIGTPSTRPTLSDVTDAGNAVADVTWQPPATTPQDHVAFAWDFYTGDWVTDFSGSGMWYWFGATDQSGQMNLGRSGAYAVWISSSYSGGGFYPCDPPWVGIISSGQPHQPIDVAAAALGNRQVRVSWKADVFGTANYWLIAYKIDAPNQGWISVQGPIGNSVWQYTAQGASEATLTMPSSGDYWIFLFAGGWDGQWSDATPVFASP